MPEFVVHYISFEDCVKIHNDNEKILSTDFWESNFCKSGFCFMSMNENAYRLLIADNLVDEWINEMATGKKIIISRGPSATNPDVFEIVFDDDTDTPFYIKLSSEQWDFTPSDNELGNKGKLFVYIKNKKEPVLEFENVKYQKVSKIPHLLSY